MIRNQILPTLATAKVAAIEYEDIDRLHQQITKDTPYRANRVLAVLSKMFTLAIRWKWRKDNPCKGVERNQERPRKRYLKAEELPRLTRALDEHGDQQAADILRLLLLTGARRGEVLSAEWSQFDLGTGIWSKPGATTKQKTDHCVPLSAPARELLGRIHKPGSRYVFPEGNGHRKDVRSDWARICKAADIEGLRVHDLRHSFASQLASGGASLPLIGALLGHTQAQTTQRYAHLFDDPLRRATERAGAVLAGRPRAQVTPIQHTRGRR
jgi:integrase